MTILHELAAAYEKQAVKRDWPRLGYSSERIGGVVMLAEDGSVREIRSLMTPGAKGKMQPRFMSVPALKRASGITPGTFRDKTAYSLGVIETEDGPGQGKRTMREHEAFKQHHLDLLEQADHPALVAMRRFCETWTPDRFASFPDAVPLLDETLVFRLGTGPFIHDLPEAQELLGSSGESGPVCLVSGKPAPVARLHPSIKGVMGAQSSGASLVSFNKDADESHGKKQGDNAQVSQDAAAAYGIALNGFLQKGSGNNLRIGGDTVVFWAEEPEIEDVMSLILSGSQETTDDAQKDYAEIHKELRHRLIAVAQGQRRKDADINPDARLFVLGLAPNAARLAVRYWYPGTLKDFAKAVTDFWDDMAIKPSPFTKGGVEMPPKLWALLYDVAPQHDAKKIPNGLGGDLMRAVLTGGPYPATWLSALIGRIRVEGEPDHARHGNVDGRRAAMIAAILRRNYKQEIEMALDETAGDAAYLLGRLFGAYVYAEKSYQDRGASLRQKYMGAASATPARVFPVLMRGYEHNLASLRKAGGQKAGAGVKADRAVAAIINALDGELPAALPLEEQGRFFIGFYHQISAFYTKAEEAAEAIAETTDNEEQDT